MQLLCYYVHLRVYFTPAILNTFVVKSIDTTILQNSFIAMSFLFARNMWELTTICIIVRIGGKFRAEARNEAVNKASYEFSVERVF